MNLVPGRRASPSLAAPGVLRCTDQHQLYLRREGHIIGALFYWNPWTKEL